MTARIRTIKPEFFTDEDLAELSIETRLLFVALWTIADREGRLEDKPRTIKIASFPWDDVDVEACLGFLASGGFIERYEVDGKRYIQIANFLKHQRPNQREAPSVIPAHARTCMHVQARGEGKGREGEKKGREREGKEPSARLSPLQQLAFSARKQAELARLVGNTVEERRQLREAEALERQERGTE